MLKKPLLMVFLMSSLTPLCSGAAIVSNQECIEAYRDGYIDLRNSVEDFNSRALSKWEFSADVAAISTEVGALRAACSAFESPDVRKCVEDYRELYKDLRGRVNLTAVMAGNQTEITYSQDSRNVRSNIDEDGNAVSRFFRNIRNRGTDLAQQTGLVLIDRRCR